MSVTLNAGDQQVRSGTFSDVETLTMSTATTRQSISVRTMITQINSGGATLAGAGTATGFGLNLFTVASFATTGVGPVEGFEKYIVMNSTASGEVKVVFNGMATTLVAGIPEIATATVATPQSLYTAASATGAFTLTLPNDFLWAKMINGQWRVLGGRATYATAT
jgi:hypothetical protein